MLLSCSYLNKKCILHYFLSSFQQFDIMTVPLHISNMSIFENFIPTESDLVVINLCYEIHGRAEQYFNLVSDSCVSVNAHYTRAHQLLRYNIIDEITVRAVDLDGVCKNVAVSVSSCQASIDGMSLNSTYSSAGVSVRMYQNRVRISAPNCQNLDLVMWVFCEQNTLKGFLELREPDITVDVNMLHFVIARGLNIRETAHGLIGNKTIKASNEHIIVGERGE